MTKTINVNVTVDPLPQVEGLIKCVGQMNVSPGLKQTLLAPLLAAQQAYRSDQPVLGRI